MSRALASPYGPPKWRARWLLLGLGLLAVPILSRSFADRLAGSIAAGLTRVLAPVSAAVLSSVSEPAVNDEAILSDAPALRAATHDAQVARASARPSRAPIAHGLRISKAQVLALAARRAIPQAVPVQATAHHPAGLLLRGVSALGVGLQDGDVLTEAAGQKASSVGAVIGIVLAARARQSPEISGRFYRAGVPFQVTVEQPYPKATIPG